MKEVKKVLHKDLYSTLNVSRDSEINVIKKSYYKLSKIYHPDVNPDGEEDFAKISEAWSILSDTELKSEYDKKSKWGRDYNELEELFMVDMEYNHKTAESSYERVKNREVLDIYIKVDETFSGDIEFARWVQCPTCKGNGKDLSNKIMIKTPDGKVKWFEGDDGCDFCDGSGKSWNGQDCTFCNGLGKSGINPCKKCEGDGRIKGKQKLSGISLEGNEVKIDSMGNWSRGRVGSLIIYKGG